MAKRKCSSSSKSSISIDSHYNSYTSQACKCCYSSRSLCSATSSSSCSYSEKVFTCTDFVQCISSGIIQTWAYQMQAPDGTPVVKACKYPNFDMPDDTSCCLQWNNQRILTYDNNRFCWWTGERHPCFPDAFDDFDILIYGIAADRWELHIAAQVGVWVCPGASFNCFGPNVLTVDPASPPCSCVLCDNFGCDPRYCCDFPNEITIYPLDL